MREETRGDDETSNRTPASPSLNRRQFLAGASLMAIGTSSTLSGVQGEERSEAIDPTHVPGIAPRPYGERSPFEERARLVASASSTTPLQDLQGVLTPSSLHFEQHHNGVPTINPSSHRLLVHGLMDHPVIFTVEELRRFPSVSRFAFLKCSGSSYAGTKRRI